MTASEEMAKEVNALAKALNKLGYYFAKFEYSNDYDAMRRIRRGGWNIMDYDSGECIVHIYLNNKGKQQW